MITTTNEKLLMVNDGRPVVYYVTYDSVKQGHGVLVYDPRKYDQVMMMDEYKKFFYTPTGKLRRQYDDVSELTPAIKTPRPWLKTYAIEAVKLQDCLDKLYGTYKQGRNWKRCFVYRPRNYDDMEEEGFEYGGTWDYPGSPYLTDDDDIY
ncbi:hypothetical protein BLD44_028435 [Mastigocladus laminosus UU774]|nr:hypothetical protein BLD44_028435 [Mastigocladus laminosus UU774]